MTPLPFRLPRRQFPNNREQVLKHLQSLRKMVEKKTKTKEHIKFMQQMIENDQAEQAPPLSKCTECWYLPTFGVYHPQKPNQIRVVFDSSAEYEGTSLVDVMLKGPDLNNSFLGVLMRFQKDPVALTADVWQMFDCFIVQEDQRLFKVPLV